MLGEKYLSKERRRLPQGIRSAIMLKMGRGFYADVLSRPKSDGKRRYPEHNTSWNIYIESGPFAPIPEPHLK